MSHLLTLATISVVAAAGAGLGTWLGHGTVNGIDPVHFRPAPPVRLAAAPVPRSMAFSAPVQAASMDYGRGCIRCPDPDYPEEYRPRPSAEIAALWNEPLEPVAAVADAEPEPVGASLARYAHYPIEAEPPAPAEEPALPFE